MAVYHTTGKELRKSPKGAIAAGIILILILGTLFGIKSIKDGLTDIVTETPSETDSDLSIPSIPDSSSTEDKIIYSYDVRFHDEITQGPLVLVNRTYGIEDTEDGLVSIYENKNEHYMVRDQEVLLQEEAILALNEMTAALYLATGIDDLQVITGYRTKEYQQQLYENYTPEEGEDPSEMAAEGGHSDHESGYSVDFNIYRDGESLSFDGTGDYGWLAEHCAEYGFILRYPEDKVSETEFAYEPWHFRYVGKPHAQYITENDLSLDEYIALLPSYTYSGEHLSVTDGQGDLYEIFYVPAAEESSTTEIPVPAELAHTLSGDNIGGYIVTVNTAQKAVMNNTNTGEDESTAAPTE